MPRAETHATATTRFADAAGVRFAHRRLGPGGDVPLVLLQRLGGTMDDWDPDVVDGLAGERSVVLFDARGVGRSTGVTPESVADMAGDVIAFLDTLECARVDLLGFSLGGMVAQQVLFDDPARVRRAILAGTGGPGASGMFGPGAMLAAREVREPTVTDGSARSQLAALRAWGEENGDVFARLKGIHQPVLVVHGTHDILIPSFNAFALSQQIRDAQLILYPEAGNGSMLQHPDWFVHDALRFLGRD